jgi:hypothetical protein
MSKLLHEVISGCNDCPYGVCVDGWDESWCEHAKGPSEQFPDLLFNMPKGWFAKGCPLPEETSWKIK